MHQLLAPRELAPVVEYGEPGGCAAAARGAVHLAVREHSHVTLAQAAVGIGLTLDEDDAVDAAQLGLLGVHDLGLVHQGSLDEAPQADQLGEVPGRYGEPELADVDDPVKRSAV